MTNHYRDAWTSRDPDGSWHVVAVPVTGRAVVLPVSFLSEAAARRYAADLVGEVIA